MIEFLSITLLITLAVISPGPDFALTVRNTLTQTSKIGVFTAIGIGTSTLMHTTYTLIGLTVLISQSPWLFAFVKYLGAGYLVYLGLKGLLCRSTSSVHEQSSSLSITALQAFKQGFLCNLLNPKAMMFFLALFTLVIHADTLWWVKVLYGLEIGLIHFLWFAFLALIIGHPIVRAKLVHLQVLLTRVMGGFLIYFGSRLALLG